MRIVAGQFETYSIIRCGAAAATTTITGANYDGVRRRMDGAPVCLCALRE